MLCAFAVRLMAVAFFSTFGEEEKKFYEDETKNKLPIILVFVWLDEYEQINQSKLGVYMMYLYRHLSFYFHE